MVNKGVDQGLITVKNRTMPKTSRKAKNAKKKNRGDIMERARAGGCYLRNAFRENAPEDLKLAAFMAIFHPEIKGKRLKNLIS